MELDIDGVTSVLLLISISATPNNERKHEKNTQSSLSPHGSANAFNIKGITPDKSSHDLSRVVEDRVESLSAGIEASTVDGVCLVGDEPVGGPEHGK